MRGGRSAAECAAVPASTAPMTRRPERCRPPLRPGSSNNASERHGGGGFPAGLDTSAAPMQRVLPTAPSKQRNGVRDWLLHHALIVDSRDQKGLCKAQRRSNLPARPATALLACWPARCSQWSSGMQGTRLPVNPPHALLLDPLAVDSSDPSPWARFGLRRVSRAAPHPWTPKAYRPVTDGLSVLLTPCCSNGGNAHRGRQRRFLPRARRPCCSADCSMTLVPSRAHATPIPIGGRGHNCGRNRIGLHCSRPPTGSLEVRGESCSRTTAQAHAKAAPT
jgi:hypothetical protein